MRGNCHCIPIAVFIAPDPYRIPHQIYPDPRTEQPLQIHLYRGNQRPPVGPADLSRPVHAGTDPEDRFRPGGMAHFGIHHVHDDVPAIHGDEEDIPEIEAAGTLSL